MKKTDCPSKLTMTVLIPTKKDRLASDKMPYLLTHPAVLKVTFNHYHPFNSAHALSFHPVSPETKDLFLELFRKGHTAASAHHWHETKLYLDRCEDQILLADRATNPTKSDISRLYAEWQKNLEMTMEKECLISSKLRLMHIMTPAMNVEERRKFKCFEGHKIPSLTVVVMRVILHQRKNGAKRKEKN